MNSNSRRFASRRTERHIRHFAFIAILGWSVQLANAQINTFVAHPDPEVFQSVSTRGAVMFNERLTTPLDQVFTKSPQAFDMASPFSMKLLRTITDIKGQPHYRFQQTYRDIPIYGIHYLLHSHADGQRSGNGKILKPQQVNETIVLSEAEALEKLLSHINATTYYWQDSTREAKARKKQNDPMATYYPKASLEFLPNDDLTIINLCYTFHIYCLQGGVSGKYYIDATHGQILKLLPANIHCEYFSFQSNFNGTRGAYSVNTGDEYELEDDCHDAVYGVYDASNENEIITDPNNVWDSDWQRSAATSQWGIKRSYYAYLGAFNRSGHDGDDGNLDIYQEQFFANGGNNNASYNYDPIGDDEINIGIGDSDEVTDDYNTLDILGHEFTHGVDQYTAELEYVGESGALDESFADIFGEWIEYTELGSNDWFLGGERLNDNNNCPMPLRYFVNPSAQDVQIGGCVRDFNHPNTYQGTHWYPINGCDPEGDTDNCGVHTNSGVQNQMFYLLVEGGSGWNNGNTCHDTTGSGYPWEVAGIGMDDAIEIGYFAHVILLGPTSDYQDARYAWVAAAVLLFGECSNQAIQTGKAWYAVGLHPPSVQDYVLCNIEYGNSPLTIEKSGRIRTGDGCTVLVNDGGSLVTFASGINVVLKPGFIAEYGSRFRSIVTDCGFARY